MSFWEEISQRITNRSRAAVQKTKNLADIMTLDEDISDSKIKIRELQMELGKMLVEEAFSDLTSGQIKELLEKNSPEALKREIDFKDWAELLTKVMYVKSEEEVIALNEEKIKALRADDVCPSCGRKVRKNMSFCPDCGARIVRVAAESPVSEPAADAAGEAAEKAVNEPAADAVVEAAESTVSETAADVASEAAESPVSETAADVVVEAAESPVSEPSVDVVVEAVESNVNEAAVDIVNEPAVDIVSEPVVDEAVDTVSETAADIVGEPVDDIRE